MRLLLDTHALLWWSDGDPKLGQTARRTIDEADLVVQSIVSVWEIATKIATGRLRLDLAELMELCGRHGIARLDVETAHCLRYATLPLLHRDPFDRMLVAQAVGGGFTLMTDDERLAMYRVPIVGCS